MDGEAREDRRPGVGALMRSARERVGEDLPDVSRLLRIRLPHLEAIEDGRIEDLPGPTYAVGFVRAYAEHLGLDGDEVVRRFKNEAAGLDGGAELRFPSPIPESSAPGAAVLVVGILLALVGYGVWYLQSEPDRSLVDVVPDVPERLARLLPEPEPEAASAAPAAAASPGIAPTEAPSPNGAGASPADVPDSAQFPPPPRASVAAAGGTAAPTPGDIEDPVDGTAAASAPADEATAAVDVVPDDAAEDAPPPAEAAPAENDIAAADAAAPTAPEVAPAPAAPVAEPADEAEDAGAGPAVSEPVAAPAEVAAVAPEAVEPEDAAPEPTAEAAPAPPTEAEARRAALRGRVFGDEGASRIVVRAKNDSWIQVRDDIGNRLVATRLLRVGDTYSVPDRPGLELVTGNAGALEILVDGVPVPPIGGQGTVRRGVALDADRLRAGTAVSE